MKILFINRVMSLWRGGGETFDLNIARELQKMGCEIEFITGKTLINKIKHPVQELHTHYIYSPYIRDIKSKIPLKGLGRFFLLDAWLFGRRVIKFLDRYLENNEVDIVQVNGDPLLCNWITKKYGIPTVVVFHGLPDKWYRKAIKRCSAVVSLGDAYNQMRKIRPDVFNLPPGVETDSFKKIPTKVREEFGIGGDKLLLFVGRLIEIKNLPFLLKVFKEVQNVYPKIKLMIIGEGRMESKLKKLSAKWGIEQKVIFTGVVPHSQLPFFYSAADIFVLSSQYETFSIVVLEAMACGLPIVATNVGGTPMLIENNVNGFLVELNNTEQLKDTLLKLLADEEIRRQMGLRNREKVIREYSWTKSAQEAFNIYKELLKTKEL